MKAELKAAQGAISSLYQHLDFLAASLIEIDTAEGLPPVLAEFEDALRATADSVASARRAIDSQPRKDDP